MSVPQLLSIRTLAIAYGEKPLFTEISFSIDPGDRWGLIGPNGSGKTTLLKLLAGTEVPDGGEIITSRGLKLAYIPQADQFAEGITVWDALNEFLPSGIDAWQGEKQLEQLRALAGFDNPEQPVAELSGGWCKRLAITRAAM